MSKLAEFLQEDNGNFSSIRLAFLFWIMGVLATWIAVSVSTKKFEPIDTSITIILGMLMTGKVVQKGGEQKMTSDNSVASGEKMEMVSQSPKVANIGGGAA